MTLPACSFPQNDPLRKVLQQVPIPAAYVTFFSRYHPCCVLASSCAGSGQPLHCRVSSHTNFSACKGHTSVSQRCADVQTTAVSHSCHMWGGSTATCFGPFIRSHHQDDVRQINCKVQHLIFIYPVHIYGSDRRL
jgi:hypothetical protein